MMPQRPHSHVQEDNSRKFFTNNMPNQWTLSEQRQDYGVDLVVEIFRDQCATGSTFIVQLKSTDKKFQGEQVSIQIDRKNLNYLKQRVEPAIIVLHVSSENEAFYIWERELQIDWEKEQQSHVINIPKSRKLSEINWNKVEEFVNVVREGKIKVGEQFIF